MAVATIMSGAGAIMHSININKCLFLCLHKNYIYDNIRIWYYDIMIYQTIAEININL